MDIRKEILKEHSKTQTMKVVDYVGDSPHRFEALVSVFLLGPYRVTQRAAWPLAYCVERHPQLIGPHLKTILNHLKKPGIHDSVKRNTIRLLQFINIPKRLQGQVVDTCFQFLSSKKEPVAVRVFSMAVLVNIARHNPELNHELIVTIEDHLPFAKPAFTSRARKALKELKQAS
jgi:hypothetical protein